MPRKLRIILLGSALLLSFHAAAAWSQTASSLKGTVVSLTGSVKFRNEQTVLWQDVQMGQELVQGDHIRTEADGKVSIKFTNGNVMALKENSAMIIEELRVDPDTGKYDAAFKAIKAKIRAEVNDQTQLNSFEIRTPTAVAGVRGTVFYVNATQTFTQVFVERGRVNLRSENSANEREVQAGFAATADEGGEVSDPIVPEPDQLLEFEGFLDPMIDSGTDTEAPVEDEPLPLTDDETLEEEPIEEEAFEEETLTEEISDTQSDFLQDQQESLQDRQLEQETTLTDYITNPPPPTGSNLSDADGDGMANIVDPDDDNDFLPDVDEVLQGTNPLNLDSDNDALTDWEELRLTGSDPLISDTDSDSIDDGGDSFPTESSILEPMTPIRARRYTKMDAIPGLRTEITTMLANSLERNRDYIMDRVSDAQLHKVTRDRNGNLVRFEEYIFRPTSNEIQMLSLSYRSSVQLSSLSWKMVFNGSLDGMSSQAIRNLPWGSFFGLTPDYGATSPARYPTQMNVRLENANGTNAIEERRTLNVPAFTGTWQQTVSADQLSIDNDAFAAFTTINLINANPAAFDYDRGGTVVDFFVYVRRDDGSAAGGTFNYSSLWQVLGTNFAGFPGISPGDHLELQANYAGPTQIDVVYFPMNRLLWRGDADWPQQLTW